MSSKTMVFLTLSVLLTVLTLGVKAAPVNGSIHDPDDARLGVLELLEKYGYPGEQHVVETTDGYVLSIYRIPYGRKCGQDQPRKQPILLQHGLLSNAIDWINFGVDNALGYLLADDCFDVWLGNSRGNFESKNHTTLDPEEHDFWTFSWHEMGEFDLPAVIQYIIDVTGQPRIHYAGHSQGTTQFFVYASLYPEVSKEKIISMHALAPVAYMENMTSPMCRWSAKNLDNLANLVDALGWNQFLPESELVANLGGNLCNEQHPNLVKMCSNLLFILCGFDSEQLDPVMLDIISGHDPAGAAIPQLLHYGQEINSKEFCRYDHGPLENMRLYGSITPPRYEIEKIQVPMYLHYGDNDWMASILDVQRFADVTPTSRLRQVPFEKFNHLDFLWANDVKSLLYDEIISQLNQDSD